MKLVVGVQLSVAGKKNISAQKERHTASRHCKYRISAERSNPHNFADCFVRYNDCSKMKKHPDNFSVLSQKISEYYFGVVSDFSAGAASAFDIPSQHDFPFFISLQQSILSSLHFALVSDVEVVAAPASVCSALIFSLVAEEDA